MHTQTHHAAPLLTTELFADILNPDMHAFEVCHRHGLDLTQLRAVTDSAHFRHNVECMRAIQAARADAMLPAMQARALRTLDAVAAQPPTTPTHTETVRRAAAAVLRLKPDTPPEPADPTHPDSSADNAHDSSPDSTPNTTPARHEPFPTHDADSGHAIPQSPTPDRKNAPSTSTDTPTNTPTDAPEDSHPGTLNQT